MCHAGRTSVHASPRPTTCLALGLAPYSNAYCDVIPAWKASTQGKLSGLFPLPYQFQVALTYQNLPGIPFYASFVATNAQIAPSLGRNLAAEPNATVTIPLIAPETQYEARIQQLDLRFSRSFRISGKLIEPQLDIYNELNASPILSVNNSYGARSWRPGTRTPVTRQGGARRRGQRTWPIAIRPPGRRGPKAFRINALTAITRTGTRRSHENEMLDLGRARAQRPIKQGLFYIAFNTHAR